VKRTPQQEAAIATEGRSLLVEAGAGTGKTAVLVERFLHLLDYHPDWPIDSIVAVTFTEKATREMRGRIRAGVEARAAAAGPDSRWQARRRELDRLAVSTIHGLCARILKENPIAAQIDPRFTVLAEQDMGLLREQAVRQAFAELASGVRLPGAEQYDAFDLLTDFETQDLQEQMLLLLAQRGTVDRLFSQLPDTERLLTEWRARVEEMQSAIWAEALALDGAYREALAQIPGIRITDPQDKLAEYIRAAQEGCACATRGELCGASAFFARIKVNVGSQGAWGGKEALGEIKNWLKQARELGASLSGKGYDQPVGPTDERAAEALQRWRVLWTYVAGVYDGLKAELRALDFDDLERLAWQLLTARPREERVQATVDGINHLMVDEFQDVNEVQGEILTALAAIDSGGKFFAVGDAKQSIYRFRQAQVKVFNRVAREIHQRTGSDALPLNRSFRTQAALLEALNAAFDKVLRPIGTDYTDFEARPGALDPDRPALEACAVAPASVDMIVLPPGQAGPTRRAEAAILARRLQELVSAGLQIWDREKGTLRAAKYADMAILFRATTALPIYEEVFKAAGLPYITVSGRGYYDRPEVRDLTALLACLHNPADDLSMAAVLRSPMLSLSDETLYQLRWPSNGTSAGTPAHFADALRVALLGTPPCSQSAQVVAAARTFEVLYAAAGRVDVWTLLRMALDRTGYEATLALEDMEATTRTAAGGGRGRANVAKFLQLARERVGPDLSAFLQSVQDLRAREAREGEALPDAPDAGAVQLMSVHAAKGLEFPVVVLADLGRGQRSAQSPRILHDPLYGLACQVREPGGEWLKPAGYRWAEWLDGRMEQAESSRLLYVACTRAADLLILSGSAKKEDTWLGALAGAWELDLSEEGEGERTADREERVDFGGYQVRVAWPVMPGEETARVVQARAFRAEPAASLDTVPLLAQPLSHRRSTWPVAVTHLPDDLEAEDELPQLRPVVQVDEAGGRGRRPWRFLVGNLAHRALADWDCLSAPDQELPGFLTRWARRGGLFEAADVASAVERATGMLHTLRSTPLYEQICAAQERHAEVPLSICAGEQVLHGVLDLLYRDAGGQWRLLDWKTEPVLKGQTLQEAAAPYVRQMAVYSRAVGQCLGVEARVEICFLSARAAVYNPPATDLTAEWDALLSQP
jgi:ATP-dependent helicase/nuclease subunit A